MSDKNMEPVSAKVGLTSKPLPRWVVWFDLTLLILSFACSFYAVWQVRRLNELADNLSFQQAAYEYSLNNDLLTPDVGNIQFMHRGFSITFDSVQYTPGGLALAGIVGNPTQMTLTSVNLKLAARNYLYKDRDKVLKDPFFLYSNESEIGSAQAAIPYLGSGRTATFSVIIPNVKQTKDGLQIVALFSGERFEY